MNNTLIERYHERRRMIVLMEAEINSGLLSPEMVNHNEEEMVKFTELNSLIREECGGFVPNLSEQPSIDNSCFMCHTPRIRI